jgi:aspartyl/asparaginyl-tRNA synthetase
MDRSLIIDTVDFDFVVSKLRTYFKNRGFLEVHPQNRLSILAACEDPKTVSVFNYVNPTTGVNEIFPLPQTSQMQLEFELLNYPQRNVPGYFSVATSYRAEPNPVPGRHMTIFPMFEFEMLGDYNDLANMEIDLLKYLGFDNIKSVEYDDVARNYNVNELTNEHENLMMTDYSPAVLLKRFPNYTSPFWNMKQVEEKTHAYKIDVILCGQETIGSAERSTDTAQMREMFDNISNGEYAQLLYKLFGKNRVDAELNEFLNYNFVKRVGGGIGMSRLIRAMKMMNLMPQ